MKEVNLIPDGIAAIARSRSILCIFGVCEYVYRDRKSKLEVQMDAIETENRGFEMLAFGLLLLWLGAWWGFLDSGILPGGSGALGVGLILLGLNMARWLKGIPISVLSTAFGALFLLVGLMKLADVARRCPMCNVNLFALFLILLGGIVLVREFLRVRETSNG
jgi:hypothetical protein